jgi:hypothetical protein
LSSPKNKLETRHGSRCHCLSGMGLGRAWSCNQEKIINVWRTRLQKRRGRFSPPTPILICCSGSQRIPLIPDYIDVLYACLYPGDWTSVLPQRPINQSPPRQCWAKGRYAHSPDRLSLGLHPRRPTAKRKRRPTLEFSTRGDHRNWCKRRRFEEWLCRGHLRAGYRLSSCLSLHGWEPIV